MERLIQRYEEITALLPASIDLSAELDDAPMEAYIMAAADHLGFDRPAIALDLDTPLEELLDLYGV